MKFKQNKFYHSSEWRRIRKEVLTSDKYECQEHKAKGRYARANHVHHVKHLDEFPELGLEKYYVDENGKQHRQLVSVCKECHETVCHPERLRWNKKEPLTEEKW